MNSAEKILEQILNKIDENSKKIDDLSNSLNLTNQALKSHMEKHEKDFNFMMTKLDAHEKKNEEDFNFMMAKLDAHIAESKANFDAHMRKNEKDFSFMMAKLDAHIEQNKKEHDAMMAKLDAHIEQNKKEHERIELRIDKLIQENKEEHEKIFEELHAIRNILTKIETEHEDKLNILFDAYKDNYDHQKIFAGEMRRLSKYIDKYGYDISKLKKVCNLN